MFEPFGWNVGMTPIAAILLVLGALIFGAIAQVIGRVVVGYEWIFTAVAALVGAWIGSEALGTLSTWGPEFEGLYVLPAVIGWRGGRDRPPLHGRSLFRASADLALRPTRTAVAAAATATARFHVRVPVSRPPKRPGPSPSGRRLSPLVDAHAVS
jgi:uncharacterized membrane protein YeaQ/YmgE (transglycosylase-associated protein family)